MATHVLLSMLLGFGTIAQAPAAQTPAPSALAAGAQTPAASPPASADADAPKRLVSETYVIGANDVLSITCLQDTAVNGKYRVDETGMIQLPYIGRVPAGGKTIAQLQADVARSLAEGQIIKNPQIFADVDSYKSQSVMVGGAVRQPGRVQMQGQLTLLDALAAAGSPSSDAGDDIQIAHHRDAVAGGGTPDTVSPDDPSIQHVRRSAINLGRNNIILQDGDTVYVTPAQHFTITGQVKNSGQYIWEDGLTLEQALARAGGLTDRGSMRSIKAHRIVNGKTVDVDLKAQDKVQPNDTINVGLRLF
jgi:polysaccharide biosynthesis/export protein